MIRYDPEWRADGHPDSRRYPGYLIFLFWLAVIGCALSLATALISTFFSNSQISASSVFALAIALATIAWVRNKSEKTAMR
jgi:hypothetical protein